jgi:bifunctional non-homologous end joining protein LigD
MRARAGDLPRDPERWVADPLWGGTRALALAEPGSARLIDAAGSSVADAPEIVDALVALAELRVVLDGDWLPRADGARGIYVAWDVLWLEGRPLLSRPLSLRRRLLLEVAAPWRGPVLALPPLHGELTDALAAVEREGLPGLLLRRSDSAYLPGVRSRQWRTVAPGSPVAPPVPRPPILAVMQRLPLGDLAPDAVADAAARADTMGR